MSIGLSDEDRRLLVELQNDFPLVERPFEAVAGRIGSTEAEVLARTEHLKTAGVLRQIGAIFDTRRLGYSSTLVACEVEPSHLDAVALVVSGHPGVSHNYARNHRFNLWFTLAVPPGADLEATVQALVDRPGIRRTLVLPTLRLFKIDVRFDLGMETREDVGKPGPIQSEPGDLLRAEDVLFVRILQEDLPVVPEPFALLAGRSGIEPVSIVEAAVRLRLSGILRRYGATLRHRQAGYGTNAMVCWHVPEDRVESAGCAAATVSSVSHCYQRPAYPPDWPYQLFTMIHSPDVETLRSTVAGISEAIQPVQYAALETVREYKKVRLRYFDE